MNKFAKILIGTCLTVGALGTSFAVAMPILNLEATKNIIQGKEMIEESVADSNLSNAEKEWKEGITLPDDLQKVAFAFPGAISSVKLNDDKCLYFNNRQENKTDNFYVYSRNEKTFTPLATGFCSYFILDKEGNSIITQYSDNKAMVYDTSKNETREIGTFPFSVALLENFELENDRYGDAFHNSNHQAKDIYILDAKTLSYSLLVETEQPVIYIFRFDDKSIYQTSDESWHVLNIETKTSTKIEAAQNMIDVIQVNEEEFLFIGKPDWSNMDLQNPNGLYNAQTGEYTEIPFDGSKLGLGAFRLSNFRKVANTDYEYAIGFNYSQYGQFDINGTYIFNTKTTESYGCNFLETGKVDYLSKIMTFKDKTVVALGFDGELVVSKYNSEADFPETLLNCVTDENSVKIFEDSLEFLNMRTKILYNLDFASGEFTAIKAYL